MSVTTDLRDFALSRRALASTMRLAWESVKPESFANCWTAASLAACVSNSVSTVAAGGAASLISSAGGATFWSAGGGAGVFKSSPGRTAPIPPRSVSAFVVGRKNPLLLAKSS